MSLIKFRKPKHSVHSNVNQLIDGFFNSEVSPLFKAANSLKRPAVNILEGDTHYTLEVAAPGFSKKDFSLKVEGDLLTISAESKTSEETESPKYNRREFSINSFSRTFTLSDQVNPEDISASYRNGILSVSVGKVEEVKAVTKEIKVS